MNHVLVMLLAGGRGSRLNILAERRAKPAVPFAGMYRIIDFALTNVMHSGIGKVGVLTQYRPSSMMDHIGNGAAWDLLGRTRLVRVLPPFTGGKDDDWYRGTADAVRQNLDFIRRFAPREVVILSGDHIYQMDYAAMVQAHRARNADLTLAVMEVPWEETERFGTVVADDDDQVTSFEEKVADARSNLASMGIYVFRTEVLLDALTASAEGANDFGHHIIPTLLGQVSMGVHRFDGYWRDVGTIKSYWDACMDALDPRSGLDLHGWRVRTNTGLPSIAELPPARMARGSAVYNSLISRGCVVEGTVLNSVLSPGVTVGRDAVVRDSVILNGTVIGGGAELDRVVVDKDVTVGEGAVIGYGQSDKPNKRFPDHLADGITLIGKDAEIPRRCQIGRNCLVYPGTSPRSFKRKGLAHGGTAQDK